MTYDNIPDELKQRVQWVCWRYETPAGQERSTKVPYNPLSGKTASTTDWSTWCAFDEAVDAVQAGKFDGIGFVFTSGDPYCGIDLDHSTDPEIIARQQVIFNEFDSYTEKSPSGLGGHIIIKGSVPHGRKRDCVEIYSSGRYFTFTGDVIHDAPIADRSELASQLWEQMTPPAKPDTGFYGDPTQHSEDEEIYNQAATAENGEKFSNLYNGDWEIYYRSQSEADFALIDIISFYTQNQPQIMRMFRASALGKRDKANRDKYIFDMIAKSFDNQLPPIDFSGLQEEIERARASFAGPPLAAAAALPEASYHGQRVEGVSSDRSSAPPQPSLHGGLVDLDYWINNEPPGLLATIRHYIYQTSPRPVYEISLVASLALLTGICGRQYNISNTGLNQYFMLVADTGKGKEAIQSGISRLLSTTAEVKGHKSMMDYIGPAEIVSGQALLKALPARSTPCFVSMVGEFGLKLQQITDPNANGAEKMLQKVMLDLWGKSGAGQVVYPTIYADKAQNTDPVYSPSFTMVGEGTGETFYSALESENVSTGLVPRFIVVEYNGPRPPMNYDHASHPVPAQITEALSQLVLHVQFKANNGTIHSVGMTPDADAFARQINEYCDNEINSAPGETIRQVWNRAHVKTLKLAAVLAIAHNYKTPIVTRDMIHWAASLIFTDTIRMRKKFEAGEMGTGNEENDQYLTMIDVLREYVEKDYHQLGRYGVTEKMKQNAVFPYAMFSRRLYNRASFKRDRQGAGAAIRRSTNLLISHGIISRVSPRDTKNNFTFNGELYAITNVAMLLTDH